MATTIDTTSGPRRKRRLPTLLLLWSAIVLAAFIWQAAGYFGLIAGAAEWEFMAIGSYFPGITIALLVILFAAPLLYVFGKSATDEPVPTDNPRIPALNFLRIMAGLAALMAMAAVATAGFPLLRGLVTPSAEQSVKLGEAAAANPPHGRVKLTGEYLTDRVAIEHYWLFGVDRAVRFVPVRAPGDRRGAIRYFAEMSEGAGGPNVMTRPGILRENGLSGPMRALFRNAGFTIAAPYHVLYASRTAEWLPYIVTSMQFALCALIAALTALYQRWRLRRISSGRRSGTPHAIG